MKSLYRWLRKWSHDLPDWFKSIVLGITISVVVLATIIPIMKHFIHPRVPHIVEKKIGGVVRVFMHDEDYYTLLVKTRNSPHRLDSVNICGIKPALIMDVPKERLMWAYIKEDVGREMLKAEIHLHSVESINGAGWESGAVYTRTRSTYRRGHTSVVE